MPTMHGNVSPLDQSHKLECKLKVDLCQAWLTDNGYGLMSRVVSFGIELVRA
jgi:hypothetical protein